MSLNFVDEHIWIYRGIFQYKDRFSGYGILIINVDSSYKLNPFTVETSLFWNSPADPFQYPNSLSRCKIPIVKINSQETLLFLLKWSSVRFPTLEEKNVANRHVFIWQF